MDGVEVPPYFLCPISLQIMRDPVIICTGITYDRESIEKWVFSGKNNTCPVTKQALTDSNITPNHTLRRLIQAWCIVNASNGVERIPTPKPPVDRSAIVKLLEEVQLPQLRTKSLEKLKQIAYESERNRRFLEAAGAIKVLATLLKKTKSFNEPDFSNSTDEVLSVLNLLQISEEEGRDLLSENCDLIQILTLVLQQGSYQSRVFAVLFLKSIFEVLNPISVMGLRADLFKELVNVLSDQISNQATKAVLQTLVAVLPWGRNRVKAAEAGAVSVLIELVLDTFEKRSCEMMLVVLDLLCGCAEGRAELLRHEAGIAVISKKILRVSALANERAVKILHNISKFSATAAVPQEMLHVGVVTKLCLVLQVENSMKTKERAKEILRLHSRYWKNSPCIPAHLVSSYPS